MFKYIKKSTRLAALFLCVLHVTHAIAAEDVLSAAKLTIETERLVLRLIDEADVQDVFEFTSDPEVVKLTGLFTLHQNYEETQGYIQSCLDGYKRHGSILWAIESKISKKVIGVFNLYAYSPKHYKAEIGYALSRNYWGKGIATEATQAIMNFGFDVLGLHRIQATFDPRNIASGRVLEKSGFQYEGLLRDYYFLRNEFCDRVMVSVIKKA
jgi:Acetyltransferases, including N-acetylases of ribosomal proteins